jgi:hypothetical protein
MTTIVLDRVSAVTAHAGVVRIACMTVAPDGTMEPSGTLIIPGSTVGPIITELAKALQDLSVQHQAKAAELSGGKQ